MGRRRHLHGDQKDVVGAVMIKFCHCIKNLLELLICCHIFFQTGFKTLSDLLHLLFALLCHFLPGPLFA